MPSLSGGDRESALSAGHRSLAKRLLDARHAPVPTPGLLVNIFCPERIDFLRQHAADATDRARDPATENSFELRLVIDAPAGPLINLSAPIVYPRRLINSDRRSFRPRPACFSPRYFAATDSRPARSRPTHRHSFKGGEAG